MPIYCSPEDDIGFVYVWFNITNHRYYIGSHKGHPNDGYIGSGKYFKRAYKKNPENFVRHIEYYGPDYRKEETDLIKFFDACDCRESYNLLHIDKTGYSISDATRAKLSAATRNMSDETRAKMSAARKGKKLSDEMRANISAAKKGKKLSDETRAKLSAVAKNRAPISEETRAKLSSAAKNRAPISEETRAKLSAVSTGKKRKPLSEETRAKISAALKGNKQTPRTDEARANISAARKGKKHLIATCPHCGKTGGARIMKHWHFDNCKFKSHK